MADAIKVMNDAADLDLTSLPSPAVPADMVAIHPSVKDVHRVLDQAFKAYRSRVDVARRALAQADRQYEMAVQRAEVACAQAAQPNKVAAVGVVRRVTLTETTIKTSKGEFPLSPDVEARAEQHGNKQVVQGWVFKSDNDRREVYLHITGPNWGDVVPFSMRHSLSEPRDLHVFANKVNVAARDVERARARIADRVATADEALARALQDRAAVENAAEAFVAAIWDVQDLRPATQNATNILTDANDPDRKVEKARDALAGVRDQTRAYAAEAGEARQRVTKESAVARARADAMSRIPDAPTQHRSLTEVAAQTSVPAQDADVLEQIRKLGELRDAGLVTNEEFDAKKAELLSRL